MTVIQNQQTGLHHLVLINGEEITEHNRKFNGSTDQSSSDIELARGNIRRYIRDNKKRFSLSFTYLPNDPDRSVDGRKCRDYLKSISEIAGTITFSIKLNPNEEFITYNGYISSYTEKLVRRDLSNNCSYYDVTIEFEEK